MKKLVSVLLCMAMIVCLLAGCASGGKETAQTTSTGEGYKVALITMDSIDQHWITLKEGAEKAASELGVELVFMAPNTKDDAQQIEQVNNAVAGGCDAVKAAGADVVCVGFDKSDAILGLIDDGYILATMAQNPDVMGYEGVKAAVAALKGEDLGGKVTDTGVSVLKAETASAPAETTAGKSAGFPGAFAKRTAAPLFFLTGAKKLLS